ncbi:amidase [Klebsiella pneumoniae]|uniref:Amidase n=1 Tax=Klebsiella pneumoniae TaxID=573 RepID=A0A377W184_KLEPN|nr:amidase [Klebsiella pneumoniae]
MSEQSYRSAGTLLAQLASGETTSVALVNHYFSRMAQFNKSLNAVVQQALCVGVGGRRARRS